MSTRSKSYTVEINHEWCKNCGICIDFCPKGVFGVGQRDEPIVEREDDCTGCTLCELRCPDFAINVREKGSGAPSRTEGGNAA